MSLTILVFFPKLVATWSFEVPLLDKCLSNPQLLTSIFLTVMHALRVRPKTLGNNCVVKCVICWRRSEFQHCLDGIWVRDATLKPEALMLCLVWTKIFHIRLGGSVMDGQPFCGIYVYMTRHPKSWHDRYCKVIKVENCKNSKQVSTIAHIWQQQIDIEISFNRRVQMSPPTTSKTKNYKSPRLQYFIFGKRWITLVLLGFLNRGFKKVFKVSTFHPLLRGEGKRFLATSLSRSELTTVTESQ